MQQDWILASEKMPEEHDSIFAKFKGTKNWKNGMFETISDTVLVTVHGEDGGTAVVPAHTVSGEWRGESLLIKTYKVVAWMPLPEPYETGVVV